MMVSTVAKEKLYTIEEYFALEDKAMEKHEYNNGIIIKMAGGTLSHNQIKSNVIRHLGNWIEENQLDYWVFDSDTKVQIESYNRFLYPDAIVLCEKPKYYKNRKDTIVNPVLIFEVSSKGTDKFDRDDKFDMYRSLPSFQEYVMIHQDKPFVQSYFRHDEPKKLWKISSSRQLSESIKLFSIDFDLSLDKVYWKVPELVGEEWGRD